MEGALRSGEELREGRLGEALSVFRPLSEAEQKANPPGFNETFFKYAPVELVTEKRCLEEEEEEEEKITGLG